MGSIEERLATVEGRLAALEGRAAQATGSAHVSGGGEALDDRHLSADWADKVVKRDLRGGQVPMIGRRYSECPAEWHTQMAAQCERSAEKNRNEVPIRLSKKVDKKGNLVPWHEQDSFEAKLHRAWAKRMSGGAAPAKASPPAEMPDYGSPDNGDELPFAVPHDVTPRHIRSRSRFERW